MSSRSAFVALVAAFSLGGGALAQEWYEDYEAGRAAVDEGECALGLARLARAASERDRASSRKNTYGQHYITYYPHLHLARAYACLGDVTNARKELQLSRRQGACPVEEIDRVESSLASATTAGPPPGGSSPAPAEPIPAEPETPKASVADVLMTRAREALAAGDLDRAETLVQEALQAEPGREDARTLAGEVQSRRPRPEPEVAEGPSLNVEERLRRARSLLARREFSRARELSLEILRANPREERAKQILDEATSRGEADRHYREGLAREGQGDLGSARQLLERAQALDPDRSEIGASLARVVHSIELDRAWGSFAEGIRAYHRGDYETALDHLSDAESAFDGDPSYHFYEGAASLSRYLLEGEKDEALAQRALAQFARVRELDADFQPDPDLFSSRIRDTFTEMATPGST